MKFEHILLIVIVGILMQESQSPTPAEPTPAPVVEDEKGSSYLAGPEPVIVSAKSQDGKTYSAAGVAISETEVLTVYHLIKGAINPSFTVLKDGQEVNVRWRPVAGANDVSLDMAIVSLPYPMDEWAMRRHPVAGEKVTVQTLTGVLAATVEKEDELRIDPNGRGIKAGDSGSPVYGEDGSLVGIISGFATDPYEARMAFIRPAMNQSNQSSVRSGGAVYQYSCNGRSCRRRRVR